MSRRKWKCCKKGEMLRKKLKCWEKSWNIMSRETLQPNSIMKISSFVFLVIWRTHGGFTMATIVSFPFSFFSKCVMEKLQKKLWKLPFPIFFIFFSLVVLILLKHQPYFGSQLPPDGWRWDDQTEPWWTLQPGSPSSASRCSPPSGSSGPPGCLASPVASCVRSKLLRIHLNAKRIKILNQIHVFPRNKMSRSELEWSLI